MPANHFSASLSELDMSIVKTIPPGGNWKDVPESIECKRLETIRASFARGEGSRSTYYGRLRPDAPSYTINTYFSRPGNGCHVHYDQDRVMSQREAARFQSFPDSFVFTGSQASINKQIGNAVAPLLAYEYALTQGEPGVFVDLFSGAGGLSLGFKWAGWTPLVANDIDSRFLETYVANIHDRVVPGDIREPAVREELIRSAMEQRARHSDAPFLVLGGPPCQGFSTAGKARSVGDERNHLFREYARVVEELQPDGFVFENVMGMLNMDQGRFFQMVCETLGKSMPQIRHDVLKSERFGVAQRRWRVFVSGRRAGELPPPPNELTTFPAEKAEQSGLPITPGARDAIGDLPKLKPREDGSHLPCARPRTDYQRLARGLIGADEYVARLLDAQLTPQAAAVVA